jgi:mRNA interferase MazF
VSGRDIEPWQVWWIDLNPQVGREQANRRPAIVVGTRLACDLPNGLAIVIPCTHTDRKLPWQPRVVLNGDAGYAMCDQIKAIDKSRMQKRHPAGSVTSPEERESIAQALRELVTVEV